MLGSKITMVEGDTALPLTFSLTDAYGPINLADATSVTLAMNGLTSTCTVQTSPGYCTLTVPSSFTATIGHFEAEIIEVLDGNSWYFPSEASLYVEVLPHTRTRP